MAFSEVISSDWHPCFFSGNLKPLLKRSEDIHHVLQNALGFFKYFGILFQGFLRPPFAEKAQRTELGLSAANKSRENSSTLWTTPFS